MSRLAILSCTGLVLPFESKNPYINNSSSSFKVIFVALHVKILLLFVILSVLYRLRASSVYPLAFCHSKTHWTFCAVLYFSSN